MTPAELAEHRPRLFGIAYRMLGSAADAEDVVQDAWLRADGHDDVRDVGAYLSTVVVRLCLDRLGSARARRETYVGPWLPEPIDLEEPRTKDSSSLSMAFLILLEALSPLERAAFLLHDVFDWTHAEIARVLDRDEPAVRQLVVRARAHVEEGKPRFAPSSDAHRAILESFAMTLATGDTAALARFLAAEAEVHSDGGGKVRAARKVVRGADSVARLLTGILAKNPLGGAVQPRTVNGAPGMVWLGPSGETLGSFQIETDGARIYKVFLVMAPEKLRAITRVRA